VILGCEITPVLVPHLLGSLGEVAIFRRLFLEDRIDLPLSFRFCLIDSAFEEIIIGDLEEEFAALPLVLPPSIADPKYFFLPKAVPPASVAD
jgi:hypothetical protein